MEAINKREKNMAFLKFAALFVVVIILVNLAVYFDFQVPKQEVNTLRAMNQKLSEQVDVQGKILSLADSVQTNFIKINQPDQLFRILEGKISNDIINLQQFANDSSFQGKIVKNMHTSYIDRLKDKKTLQDIKDIPIELQKVKEELKETKDALRDCKMDLKSGT